MFLYNKNDRIFKREECGTEYFLPHTPFWVSTNNGSFCCLNSIISIESLVPENFPMRFEDFRLCQQRVRLVLADYPSPPAPCL